MNNIEKILQTEYSEEFDRIRKNMIVTSHYKYGYIKETAKSRCVEIIPTLEKRLEEYKRTGNTEFLADIANFAMIEFMYPQHSKGHYKPTDSTESPGVVGMAPNEIRRYAEEHAGEY